MKVFVEQMLCGERMSFVRGLIQLQTMLSRGERDESRVVLGCSALYACLKEITATGVVGEMCSASFPLIFVYVCVYVL